MLVSLKHSWPSQVVPRSPRSNINSGQVSDTVNRELEHSLRMSRAREFPFVWLLGYRHGDKDVPTFRSLLYTMVHQNLPRHSGSVIVKQNNAVIRSLQCVPYFWPSSCCSLGLDIVDLDVGAFVSHQKPAASLTACEGFRHHAVWPCTDRTRRPSRSGSTGRLGQAPLGLGSQLQLARHCSGIGNIISNNMLNRTSPFMEALHAGLGCG